MSKVAIYSWFIFLPLGSALFPMTLTQNQNSQILLTKELPNQLLENHSSKHLAQHLKDKLQATETFIAEKILQHNEFFSEHYSHYKVQKDPQSHPLQKMISTESSRIIAQDLHNAIILSNKQKIILATITQPDTPKIINRLCLSPDESILVASTYQGPTYIWHLFLTKELHDNTLSSIEARHLTTLNKEIVSMQFSADSKLLAAGTCSGKIYLFDALIWRQKGSLEEHQNCVIDLAFSHNGTVLASCDINKTIIIRNLKNPAAKCIIYNNEPLINQQLHFKEDGTLEIKYYTQEGVCSKQWIPFNKESLLQLSLEQLLLTLKLSRARYISYSNLMYTSDQNVYDSLPLYISATIKQTRMLDT